MSGGESGDGEEVLFWKRVFDEAAAAMAILDLQGRHLHVNDALCRLLGYSKEKLCTMSNRDTTHPDDLDEQFKPVDLAEKRLLRSDGSVVWVLLSRTIIGGDADGCPRVLTQFHDVTARRDAEARWERSFANAPIGMALVGPTGRWTEVNDALCELLGYSREELLSMSFEDITIPEDRHIGPRELRDLLDGKRESFNIEKRYRHRDGHQMWILIRATAVPGADGRTAYVVSQYEEVGDWRVGGSHLAHLALHDPLTGLANRALLTDRLEHARNQLTRRGGVLAVVIADLDGLKPVNDEHGHAWGDRMLVAAANALLATVESSDTVARVGGDEYVVVSFAASEAEAEALHNRVERVLNDDSTEEGSPFVLRASTGVAVTGDPAMPPERLLEIADREMYAVKKSKRNTRE